MAYVMEITEDKAKMTDTGLGGPGFSQEQANEAVTMEVLGSSFSDPGEDCCTFRLLNKDGGVIAQKIKAGY